MQYYMMALDLNMFVMSLIARAFPGNIIVGIMVIILAPIYVTMFSMYPFFRCYPMMPKGMRKIGIVGYSISHFVNVLYCFGALGLVANTLAVYVLIAVMPFAFIYGSYLFRMVVTIIQKNPLHTSSGKQIRLMYISNATIVLALTFAAPCCIFAITGLYYDNSPIVEFASAVSTLTVFVCVLSNFLVTANRYLEDKQIAASGTSLFTNHV